MMGAEAETIRIYDRLKPRLLESMTGLKPILLESMTGLKLRLLDSMTG